MLIKRPPFGLVLVCAVLVLCATGAAVQTPAPSAGSTSFDIDQLKREAEAGKAAAQVNLALAYMNGTGVSRDYAQAAIWVRKAADQGFPGPQFMLGNLYVNGQGVLQDYKEAAVWFRKAAEQGHPQSLVVLGVMHREGSGVPKDFIAAHKWFNLGAALSTTGEDQKIYAGDRDDLAKSMTAAQIEEAQKQAREWLADLRRRGGGIPPPPAPPPASAPVPVGGGIHSPQKVKDAEPVYPPIAIVARVQGNVLVAVTVGATGKVERAQVVRSIPLLDAAALDAVKQWEYTPTLLNGVPVPVTMTVTVAFNLK